MPPAVKAAAQLSGAEEKESLLTEEKQGVGKDRDNDDDDNNSDVSDPLALEAADGACDADNAAAIVKVPQWRIQAALFLLAFKVPSNRLCIF